MQKTDELRSHTPPGSCGASGTTVRSHTNRPAPTSGCCAGGRSGLNQRSAVKHTTEAWPKRPLKSPAALANHWCRCLPSDGAVPLPTHQDVLVGSWVVLGCFIRIQAYSKTLVICQIKVLALSFHLHQWAPHDELRSPGPGNKPDQILTDLSRRGKLGRPPDSMRGPVV